MNCKILCTKVKVAQLCPTLCYPMDYMLLLLLSPFSRVQLCATP